jgi:arylformamidase
MKIIDISWPISSDMTAYKDKKVVAIEHTKIFERDHARESVLRLGAHTGTHIDAPAHFLADGALLDQQPLANTVGPCTVIDMTHINDCVDAAALQACALNASDIVLFKTRNSALAATAPFDPNFVYVAADAAQYLVTCGVKAVGIDYLGIERNQPDHATHTVLLGNGIAVIEGLRLAHVQPGSYFLWCLPLAVQGVEAAPARAILISVRGE